MSEGEFVDQGQLIAALVHNTEFLQTVRQDLDPKIWRTKAQQYTVKLILALFDANKVAPRRDTLLRAVAHNVDREDFRNDVQEVIRGAYAESPDEAKGSFADELLLKIKTLARLNAGEKYVEHVTGGDFAAADKAINQVKMIGAKSTGYNYLDRKNVERRCDPNRAAYDRNGVVPTGFSRYDASLGGGIGYPELHVVCAASGAGKSRFVNNIAANNVLAGRNVCYVTLEMSEGVVGTRTDQILTGLEVLALKEQEGAETLERALQTIEKREGYLDIVEFPEGVTSCDEIEGYLLRHDNHFDLVIIDYLDLMINCKGTKIENEWKAEAQKFVEARRMSRSLGSAIITVIQPKNVEDGVILGPKQARGAYGKIDAIDSFASINMDHEDEAISEFTLSIGKTRYAAKEAAIRYGFKGETFQVWEIG